MKKVFHLSTCSTCQRIIKSISFPKETVFQDIKQEPISEKQLEQMKNLAGNYESLFSRRAIKYRAMGLDEKTLSESDYKELILKEYTFLKRPVIIFDEKIFIGNSKKTIQSIHSAIK